MDISLRKKCRNTDVNSRLFLSHSIKSLPPQHMSTKDCTKLDLKFFLCVCLGLNQIFGAKLTFADTGSKQPYVYDPKDEKWS